MIENSLRHNGLADSSPVPDVEGEADFIHSFETEYSLVIDYASEISELVESRSIRFICFNDLCYHSHSKLCGKTELLPDIFIDYSLEKHLIEEFPLESYFGNKVACFAEFDKCFHESIFLLFVGKQFDLECFEHFIGVITQHINASRFLSTLKDGTSSRKRVVREADEAQLRLIILNSEDAI